MSQSGETVGSAGSLGRLHALVEAGYPRPQLVRPGWTDLCGEWELAYDDADVGRDQGWWRPTSDAYDRVVEVPFPPESERSGVSDGGFHPVVWYRRRVGVPPRAQGERLLLHFGAVDYEATVWVNGQVVGAHRGGHTPFTCDLRSCEESELVIVVRAEDRPGDPYQPRGKQDWRESPHRIWYGRTTGIWQPVWVELVPEVHVERVLLTPDLGRSLVVAELALSAAPEGVAVRVRLSLGDELVAEQVQRATGRDVRLVVHVAGLENVWDRERFEWSPESPQLLGAELTILGTDGEPADTVLSYVGLRSVGVADRRFLLNDRPTYLRMVLAQGYWAESHLAAPDRSALRAEVELIKSFGFNGVRVHQKIEDPRFLYWADRVGLLVWEEMPSPAGFSATGAQRLVVEWLEVVERDRGHPSVVAWVPFNESWGVAGMARRSEQRDLVAAVAALTRAIDPTRPVVSNDGWEHVDSDIWGIHDYASTGEALRQRYGSPASLGRALAERWPALRRVVPLGVPDRGQPVVLSEFGGVALPAEPDPQWHGYSVVDDAQQLADRLRELFLAVQECEDLAGFCYTQLADTEQESNGLVWADRKPKVPVEDLRSIVRGDAG